MQNAALEILLGDGTPTNVQIRKAHTSCRKGCTHARPVQFHFFGTNLSLSAKYTHKWQLIGLALYHILFGNLH